MTDKVQQSIAVSEKDYRDFGYPYCGYRSGRSPISGRGTAVVICGECDCSFAVLGDGVARSTIGLDGVYPELQPHPRNGTLAHGRLDKRPEGGGEFFRSRGIGYDSCTCFVCGTNVRDEQEHSMLNNIAAFVQCREAGVRVVAMFPQGARLDYRDFEPDYVQVKVGACDEHLPNLERLDKLVGDGVIKPEMVTAAIHQ